MSDRPADTGAGRRHSGVEGRADRRIGKTRRALTEALTDLILETGYERLTIQEIIDRADISRSTFYAHFTDKDHLLDGHPVRPSGDGPGHLELEGR